MEKNALEEVEGAACELRVMAEFLRVEPCVEESLKRVAARLNDHIPALKAELECLVKRNTLLEEVVAALTNGN